MPTSTPCNQLGRNLRILVAVPHRNMASTLAAMLRAFGVETVREAHDSTQICFLLKSIPFDAVILDDGIGPERGIALTRRMRQTTDCPNAAVPVVLISASAERKFIETARDAGIHEFVLLPVSADTLRAHLCAAIANPRAFVSTPVYTGPDRRRRRVAVAGPDRRSSR